MNDTHIADALVNSIKYATLTASNYSAFMQTFKLKFQNALANMEKVERNGYVQGQEIYAFRDGDESPLLFSLPKSGECRSENKASIKFLVNATTGCTFRVSRCDEAQQAIQRMAATFIPTWVRSSPEEPSPNSTNALVVLRNRTDMEVTLTADTTISLRFAVRFKDVTLTADTTISLRFAVRFKDVTPAPSYRFAALPYIDLRLPNDFFYPFLAKSAVSYSIIGLLVLAAIVS
ncbi:unnamed protein product [Strongylus vulgaris]|uniref:Tectonic-1-3 domain-containing protein n=1 Tax=Strongylus vulgaris TaxID=40348 RepID=A0A3P7JFN0_STRVU|nr:unnamed protein product [Strongylus vulgaris]